MSYYSSSSSRPSSCSSSNNGGEDNSSRRFPKYTSSERFRSSRPSSAGSCDRTSASAFPSANSSGSSFNRNSGGDGGFSNGGSFSDRTPRTRQKLSELPTFRESLRNYSPSARKYGEDILNDLKEQMKRESNSLFGGSSGPNSSFGSFGRKAKVSQSIIRFQG